MAKSTTVRKTSMTPSVASTRLRNAPSERSASLRKLAKERKPKKISSTPGERVGSKKSDMRWRDTSGVVWSSRFEYEVYIALLAGGVDVRKTTESDQLLFSDRLTGCVCGACGATEIVKPRRYTPDLYVSPQGSGGSAGNGAGYYIEAKGYIRSERRRILRSFRQARPDINLRVIIQRDYKVGKSTLAGWVTKYMKIPVTVWNGTIPEDWK